MPATFHIHRSPATFRLADYGRSSTDGVTIEGPRFSSLSHCRRARLSPPATGPDRLDQSQWPVGFRHRCAGGFDFARGRPSSIIRLKSPSPPNRLQAESTIRASTMLFCRSPNVRSSKARMDHGDPPFGRFYHLATVWVNGTSPSPRGRLHAVQRRRHASPRPAAREQTWWCAPTTTRRTSPSRAASRTGSSSRTRSGIRARPASGRRSGSRGAAPPHRVDALDARAWRHGASGCSTAAPPDPAKMRVRLRVEMKLATAISSTTRYRVDRAARSTRRIALSDPGIDDYRNELLWSPSNPTLIEAELELRSGRRGRRPGAQLHGAALRGRAGRPLPPERPAVSRCAWCSTRATGRSAG